MAVHGYRYTWSTGLNLFDILNQLPHFGVGRIVTLGRWQYFSPNRPSYYKITEVKVDCGYKNLNHGEVWGVPTKNGYTRDGLEERIKVWYLREWILIRKSDEAEFCRYIPSPGDFKQIPKYVRMPPLFEELVFQEKEGVNKPLSFPKVIPQDFDSKYYFMDDDETISDYGKEIVDIDNVGDLTEAEQTLQAYGKPMKTWDWQDIWKKVNNEIN